jgi:hypothetical protein
MSNQSPKPIPENFRGIACVPCLDGMQIGYVPYKNSAVRSCCQCGTKVFVGPESLKVLKEQGIPIYCMICLVREYGEDAVRELMQPLTKKKMGSKAPTWTTFWRWSSTTRRWTTTSAEF